MSGRADISPSFANARPEQSLTARFYFRDPAAPRPNQPRRPGVLAVIEHDGRVLLDRRADAPVWGFIGGLVEHDETLEDALRREVREETGLHVARYQLFGTFSDPGRVIAYPDGNVLQLVTLAYTVGVDDVSQLRHSAESVELRFFERDRLPPKDFAATHRPILERYLDGSKPPVLA